LLGPAERLDPAGGAAVPVRARRTRDLPVRDVADEQVPEGVLRLGGDRGRARAAYELLALERVQQLFGLPARDAVDRLDGAEPEHLADDGGILEQALLLPGERVEPRRDDPLNGFRQTEDVAAL